MNNEWKIPIHLEKELQSEEYPISHLPGIILWSQFHNGD